MSIDAITYQSPAGSLVSLTTSQIKQLEAAGVWPLDSQGQAYCKIVWGSGLRAMLLKDEEITRLISGESLSNILLDRKAISTASRRALELSEFWAWMAQREARNGRQETAQRYQTRSYQHQQGANLEGIE